MPDDRAAEVIMPALGMAQDTGRLLRWLKDPGARVEPGDALFEVETDKTTMEVEAQVAGWMASDRAPEGTDVPVGQVIARIAATPQAGSQPGDTPRTTPMQTASSETAPTQATAPLTATPQPAATQTGTPSSAVMPATTPGTAPGTAADDPRALVAPDRAATPAPAGPRGQAGAGGRILASPKARRLAAEAGLDLARLAAAGRPQPYHAADIDLLRSLTAVPPAPGAVGAVAAVTAAATTPLMACQIVARAPRAAVEAFCRQMHAEAGITLDPRSLWLAFAAAALRQAAGHPPAADLVIELAPLDGPAQRFASPDRARLSAQPLTTAGPDLVLRDLTGSALVALSQSPGPAPVLCIGAEDAALRLTLDFTPDRLDEAAAVALVCDLARRLADPLAHLV